MVDYQRSRILHNGQSAWRGHAKNLDVVRALGPSVTVKVIGVLTGALAGGLVGYAQMRGYLQCDLQTGCSFLSSPVNLIRCVLP